LSTVSFAAAVTTTIDTAQTGARSALEIERSTATIRFDLQRGRPHAKPAPFDSAARELKAMAAEGLVTIVREETRHDVDRELIDRIAFARVR
jgi:hypothetical protein